MCGRFTQRYAWSEVLAAFGLSGPAANLRPRYNVAPSQNVAAVRRHADGRRLSPLRWGLIPSWAREPFPGRGLINARAETAHAKPAFRAAWRARRCLIPADGFYEWTRRGGEKRPWLIEPVNGVPFAFAGLWERWTVPRGVALTGSLAGFGPGDVVETCTVLTTAANEVVAPIHDRMPVILDRQAFDPWLAGGAVPLGPCPPQGMIARRVSTVVNSPANDDLRCVEPPPAA